MRQPDYLAVTLDRYEPSRSLRSSTQHLLSVPFCNTVLGKRRFSVAAPLVWNSLPLDLRTANSLPVFKNNLKTFLFRRDFNYATERLRLHHAVKTHDNRTGLDRIYHAHHYF